MIGGEERGRNVSIGAEAACVESRGQDVYGSSSCGEDEDQDAVCRARLRVRDGNKWPLEEAAKYGDKQLPAAERGPAGHKGRQCARCDSWDEGGRAAGGDEGGQDIGGSSSSGEDGDQAIRARPEARPASGPSC